ncbi:hypothetical protein VTO42DRAFT_2774 [Malbranchea cinnamomea]
MHTPTTPGTSHSSQASWATATPHNVRQLELQSEKVKKYLKRCTQSPPSPTTRAVGQLGCRMAMHNAAILAARNRELLAANEKQKRKRERRQRFTECERVVEQPEEQPQKRVARQCSICGAVERTARTCFQPARNRS